MNSRSLVTTAVALLATTAGVVYSALPQPPGDTNIAVFLGSNPYLGIYYSQPTLSNGTHVPRICMEVAISDRHAIAAKQCARNPDPLLYPSGKDSNSNSNSKTTARRIDFNVNDTSNVAVEVLTSQHSLTSNRGFVSTRISNATVNNGDQLIVYGFDKASNGTVNLNDLSDFKPGYATIMPDSDCAAAAANNQLLGSSKGLTYTNRASGQLICASTAVCRGGVGQILMQKPSSGDGAPYVVGIYHSSSNTQKSMDPKDVSCGTSDTRDFYIKPAYWIDEIVKTTGLNKTAILYSNPTNGSGSSNDSGSSFPYGLVIGLSVGGVALILAIVFYIRYRRKMKKMKEQVELHKETVDVIAAAYEQGVFTEQQPAMVVAVDGTTLPYEATTAMSGGQPYYPQMYYVSADGTSTPVATASGIGDSSIIPLQQLSHSGPYATTTAAATAGTAGTGYEQPIQYTYVMPGSNQFSSSPSTAPTNTQYHARKP
ncbi:hypothetical protein GQ42DRAFT_160152 [Ramicandelaber brevisporus]|nr:hypothetical protein GQ42DRAFT_160152 [Ramicandelaber brevisporus]